MPTFSQHADTIQLMNGMLDRVIVAGRSELDLRAATKIILDMFCEVSGWPLGHAYELAPGDDPGENELVSVGVWHLENPEKFDVFRRITESIHFEPGQSLPGSVVASGKPYWTTELGKDSKMFRRRIADVVGLQAGFAFPAVIDLDIVMVFELFSNVAEPPSPILEQLFPRLANLFALVVDRKRREGVRNCRPKA